MTFDRLGRFAVRRRWWIVAAWAALLLLALPFAPRAPSALSAGGFILDDLESARAKQVLQRELGVEPSAFVLVYTSDTLTAGTPAWLTAVAAATKDVAGAPHVTRVLSHVLAPRQVSADGHTAYDIVFLDLPPDDSPDAIPPVAARLHEVPGLTVRIGGGPAFYAELPA
jgi:RND superfamily putative drug exporter